MSSKQRIGFFDLGTGRDPNKIGKEKASNKKIGCDACKLNKKCITPEIEHTGEGKKGILFISEYPSKYEDKRGTIFSKQGRELLESTLDEIDINLDKDCWSVHAIRCRPEEGEPSSIEVGYCRDKLRATIKQLDPKVIITLGKLALDGVIGDRISGRLTGTKLTSFFGEFIPDQELETWICPTYGVDWLLRQKSQDRNRDKIDPVLMRIFKHSIKTACNKRKGFFTHNLHKDIFTTVKVEEAIKWIKTALKSKKPHAFDYETTGIKPHEEGHEVICCSFSSGMAGYAFPYFEDDEDFVKLWYRFTQSKKVGKIAHNLPFENTWTKYRAGGKFVQNWYWDTCIAAHCINSFKPTGQKFWAYAYLGILSYDDSVDEFLKGTKADKKEFGGNAFNNIKKANLHDLLYYNAQDSQICYHIMEIQISRLRGKFLQGYKFFQGGSEVLSQIQNEGLHVNMDSLYKNERILTRKIDRAWEKIQDYPEFKKWEKRDSFNPNSDTQLSTMLYDILKYKKPPKGESLTDKAQLVRIDTDFTSALIPYREMLKMRDTYLAQFKREQVSGVIRPSFNLNIAKTFRSSSSGPNFQNMPARDPNALKYVMSNIVPRKGNKLVEWDYKGVEVTVSACVTGDTLVKTTNGSLSMVDVISNISNSVYVYGYDFEKERICIAKVLEGGITHKNAKLVKVTLDNNVEIKCTPDHKFLLRNGIYKEARLLQEKDSLMPLYMKKYKSPYGTVYKEVYLNNGKRVKEHNLIALDVFGVDIQKDNKVVHHKDHNGCNNSFDNIEIMDRKAHMKIHSKEGWENGSHEKSMNKRDFSKFNQAGVNLMKNLTPKQLEEHKQKTKEGLKRVGANKGSKNGMFGKKHSPETLEKIAKSRKGKATGRIPWCAGLTKDTDLRLAKMAEDKRGKKNSPETIEKIRKSSTGRKHTPESIKKMQGRVFSEDARSKISRKAFARWEKIKDRKETCSICDKEFTKVTNTHLLHKHDMSLQEYKQTYNHKVKSVEFLDYTEDVYNITVEGCHNYAISDGVIIKNCYHKDPNMIKYILDERNDMHRDTAADLLIKKGSEVTKYERQVGKNKMVFPGFYGMGPSGIAPAVWEELKQDSKDHLYNQGVRSYRDFYRHVEEVYRVFWEERFPVYSEWKNKTWKDYQKRGYVDLYTGFRYYGPAKFTQVTNAQIQGSAFHVLLWSLQGIYPEVKANFDKSHIIGQIHDAIVADVRPEDELAIEQIVKHYGIDKVREHWDWLILPFKLEKESTDVDGTWNTMQGRGYI